MLLRIFGPIAVMAFVLGLATQQADAGCRRPGLRASRDRPGLLKRIFDGDRCHRAARCFR